MAKANKMRFKLILGFIAGILFYPALPLFAEGMDPLSYNPLNELQAEFRPASLPPVLRATQLQRQALDPAAPQTPVIVTDEEGNQTIYQGGQLRLRIDIRGNTTFYSNGQAAYEKDDFGRLTRTFEHSGNRTTTKNEFGEVLGHQEFGMGGLLLRGYDEKNRLIQTYAYEGKRLKESVDLLTNSRTLYNERGKPDREIDFQGGTKATYHYTGSGKLAYKVDAYGNRTTYDDIGRPQVTKRSDDSIVETYNWTSRNTYSVTTGQGRTTYYDHDRQQYETQLVETLDGIVTRNVKTYAWQGTKLISSTDLDLEETTYYENGRSIQTRYNPTGQMVGLWKYDQDTGILVSYTYRYEGTTYYDHGRQGATIKYDNFDLDSLTQDYKPTLYDQVLNLVRQYKDTSHSIAPDIEELLREMLKNNG